MRKTKRLLTFVLILALVLSFAGGAFAVDVVNGDIVILATNDVHNGVGASEDDDGKMLTMGYANLAAYVKEMESAAGKDNVTLIDAGDALQGEAIGTLSKGEYLIDIMNYLDYDLAIPGNHEFDYGMDRFLELAGMADFPYVASNFMDLKANKPVFDAYKMFTYGSVKVAYVGVSTPETFTKSTPTYFQDGNGNYIYGFCEGNDGKDLYSNVQSAVDAAKKAGADYVIAVTHLGIDDESKPWTSKEVIANTTGIDAVIDGHSHSTINGDKVANKDGDDVILVQAGTKLSGISKVVIKAGGAIQAEVVSGYDKADEDADKFVKDIQASFQGDLDKVVAKTDVTLYTVDPETGKRIVRNMETNLGDLCADAYRELLGADIAFVNGGGVRADIPAGDITYGQIIAVHPFGNMACLIEATGQQILDALELGSSAAPGELGGFLQVSGISYTIDTTIKSSVVLDDKGSFVEVSGDRRVKDVKVGGVDIDPEKTYTLASHNFMLKSGGDGYTMFQGNKILRDEVLIDNQVLINYIVDVLGGVVGEKYANPYGQGRISILSLPFTDISADDWFTADVLEAVDMGLINGMTETTFVPGGDFTRAMLATLLYRLDGEPEVAVTDAFPDVDSGDWFAKAVSWAYAGKLVTGYEDGSFGPQKAISRQEMITFLYRYAQYKNYAVSSPDNALDSFGDKNAVAEYALPAMKWAVSISLVQGDDKAMLTPLATANRAQGAVLLLRFAKTEFEFVADLAYKITEVSKYGNITLDIPKKDFLDKGYAYGDMLSVKLQNGAVIVAPLVSNYSDVDNGSVAVLAREADDNITMAINMGNFAGTYGVNVGNSLDIEMKEKGAYYDEYLSRQVVRTDDRKDYSSDAVFANFRTVAFGDMAAGVFYRSSSPVNPEIARNTYADKLAKDAGIKTFINLADTDETLQAYEGYGSSYYKTIFDKGGVIALNMGVDFSAADFESKLKEGLIFLGQAEGPVLIHCNEGKDRAGFVSAVLEALMGATLDEIVGDYMVTYENYYHVEKGSEQWEAIANSNIRATLAALAGLEKGSDLSKVNFVSAAESYLAKIGLTSGQISAIKTVLGTPVSATALAA